MNKRRYLALLLVAVFTIGTILVPERNTYAAKKTQLNKKSVTIEIGKTVTLKLKNAPKGKKIKWTSSKKKVAVVNSKGRVQGKSAGKAKITAKVGKKKYTCTVTVKKKEKPQQVTTEAPTTQTVTEAPTTTEIPTTEVPTTEAPATENTVIPDMSKYGPVSEIEVNGNKYKFIDDLNNKLSGDAKCDDIIKYSIQYENWGLSWLEFDPEKSNYFDKKNYLKFLGKITVIDEFKKDVSNNVFFTETRNTLQYNISMYFVDSNGVLHGGGGFIITPYYSITSQMDNYSFDYKNDIEGYGLHGTCYENK